MRARRAMGLAREGPVAVRLPGLAVGAERPAPGGQAGPPFLFGDPGLAEMQPGAQQRLAAAGDVHPPGPLVPLQPVPYGAQALHTLPLRCVLVLRAVAEGKPARLAAFGLRGSGLLLQEGPAGC